MISINPVAFSIFGISIHWYGIMIALGVLTGAWVASFREKKLDLPKDTGLNVLLCALPVGIICARIYYVIFSWEYFSAHPAEIFAIRGGGLAIYGGLIGGVLTAYAYARLKKLSFGRIMDLMAPGIAVGQAFGRWGNFFNQEAYGSPILNESLQFFPVGVYIDEMSGWFCATFFYESVWCLLLCITLLTAERKRLFSRDGDVMLWYIAGYAVERVLIEGLRTDSLYWGHVRVSQLLSAVLLATAAIWFILRIKNRKWIWLATPGILLLLLALSGVNVFALNALLAAIQLIFCAHAYNIIRKKAYHK